MEKPKAWNRGVFSLTTNQFLPNRFLQNLQDQTMQMWELAVSLANLCEEKKSHQYRTLKSLCHPVCPTDFITFLPEKQHLSQAAEQGRSYTWMAVIMGRDLQQKTLTHHVLKKEWHDGMLSTAHAVYSFSFVDIQSCTITHVLLPKPHTFYQSELLNWLSFPFLKAI